jgi:hypothetical protein
VDNPETPPYSPALQGVHAVAPAGLYVPAGHTKAVGDVLPAAQANPAVQFPVQDGVVKPPVAPYFPASHSPEQLELLSPLEAPYKPGAQGAQVPALPTLNSPA